MDLTQVGIGLSVVGSGLTLAAVFPMNPKTKRFVGTIGIVMTVFGVGILGYGFIGSARQQGAGDPTTINQSNTNSPGGSNSVTINKGPQSRKLTPEQESRFMNVLKDNPRGHVVISCIESGGPEPCDFAHQLERLLKSKEAGWTVDFSPIMMGAGDPTKTIPPLYLEAQSDTPPPFAFALKKALKSALGREPDCFVKADQPPDFLQLTIWHNQP